MALSLIFTAMTLYSYAQPPLCDTCNFDYNIKWNPKFTDSVSATNLPQSENEFGPCGSDTLNKKSITYIHGLGGSVASWDKQVTWTEENYQAATIVANYNGANWESSFHQVAFKLNGDINTGLSSGINQSYPNRCSANDFAIVHSQGGIAARYLDRQWDVNTNGTYGNRKFYGIASFGTPHAGADVALTIDEHYSFIQKVITSVFLENTYNYRGWFVGIDKLLDSTDAFIKDKLAPIMIADVHTNTLDEMAPGSATMDSLNSHQSKVHKVAFYGIEDAPEAWRVMDNMTTKAAEDYPIFTATSDQNFVDKIESVRNDHVASFLENKAKRKRIKKSLGWSDIGYVVSSGGVDLAILRLLTENNYRNEAIAFLNNANTEWRYLIGSHHRDSFVLDTVEKYIVSWSEKYAYGGWIPMNRAFTTYSQASLYSNSIQSNFNRTVTSPVIDSTSTEIKILTIFPSDGVVLAKSQLAYPGVGNRTDLMEHDNHFQERNSPETERVLLKLFKGDYDTFFTTTEK